MTAERSIIDGAGAMRAEAVATLAQAFADDPTLSWIIPDPAARPEQHQPE